MADDEFVMYSVKAVECPNSEPTVVHGQGASPTRARSLTCIYKRLQRIGMASAVQGRRNRERASQTLSRIFLLIAAPHRRLCRRIPPSLGFLSVCARW